jgi:hypothetical protein
VAKEFAAERGTKCDEILAATALEGRSRMMDPANLQRARAAFLLPREGITVVKA